MEFLHEIFRNVQESTQSKFFVIILPTGKLFGKKVNYTTQEYKTTKHKIKEKY